MVNISILDSRSPLSSNDEVKYIVAQVLQTAFDAVDHLFAMYRLYFAQRTFKKMQQLNHAGKSEQPGARASNQNINLPIGEDLLRNQALPTARLFNALLYQPHSCMPRSTTIRHQITHSSSTIDAHLP